MEMNGEQKQTTRERILYAALELIGKEGVQRVTIRKIAAAAGVNVAAVNYYFGSKDNVINEALVILTDQLTKSFDCLDDVTMPPPERLRNFLRNYADATLKYADVFRGFIQQVTQHDEVSFEYSEFMKKVGWEKLKVVLSESTGIQDEGILVMKIFQMFSSLSFPVMLGDEIRMLERIDYCNEMYRNQYVELLLDALLQPSQKKAQ